MQKENPSHFWDTRYAEPTYVYGTAPNQFFRACLDALPPGRLLLLAEGEGRNAVYAAEQGWQVTAVDFSERGREKALTLAASRGVHLDYHLMDIRQFDFEALGPWDAIGLIFAHFPPDFRTDIHRKCLASLRPGRQLILEAFNPGQLQYHSGGPKDVALLYTPDLLRADFAGASDIELSEVVAVLEEGPYHSGVASVVRGRVVAAVPS